MLAEATRGAQGGGRALPHLSVLQERFGPYDLSGITAHVGGAAAEAATTIGAKAYAMGESVVFDGTPDLRTAAHEAAHVLQQRSGVSLEGGVGRRGDAYERHADAVADAVTSGVSAVPVLNKMVGKAARVPFSSPSGAAVQRVGLVDSPRIPGADYSSGETVASFRRLRGTYDSTFSKMFYSMRDKSAGGQDFCSRGSRAPAARAFMSSNKARIADYIVRYATIRGLISQAVDPYRGPFPHYAPISPDQAKQVSALKLSTLTSAAMLGAALAGEKNVDRIVLNQDGIVIGYTAYGGETHGGCRWDKEVLKAYDLEGGVLAVLKRPSTEPLFSPIDLIGLGLGKLVVSLGRGAFKAIVGKVSKKMFSRLAAAGGRKAAKEAVEDVVWASIKATESALVKGTAIPRSFELSTKGGLKYWVHPNATKHMGEYIRRLGMSHGMKMQSQAMLKSFKAAVDDVVAGGVQYGKMHKTGGWELIFSAGRGADKLPVIKHALYIP